MEHPLIGDISGLTPEQLLEKINELHRKLGIAQRTGNAHLCNQVRMAIESYQNRYQAAQRQAQEQNPVNFNGIINIE
jgi:hypothetical protein